MTKKPRFFVGRPGTPVKPHSDQEWVKYEVGDRRGMKRICVTNTEEKAKLICAALEQYYTTKK